MLSLWILLFLLFLGLTLLAAGIGFRLLEAQRKRAVSRIHRAAAPEKVPPQPKILINPDPLQLPQEEGLFRFRVIRSLQEYIFTADLGWRVEGVLIAMPLLGVAGALLGLRFRVLVYPDLSSAAMGALSAMLPFLYIKRKRQQRLNQFEKQFPEALDFIARSVKAGHAFSVSLELLASESSEPLQGEFRRIFRELNLGADLQTALTNLVRRVPLVDVRFFVAAVLLQKDTGGNLAEMLTKLAYVIRERFRIKGQVRSASAHGRITAAVLSLMPLILAFGLSIVSPDYLPSTANDPLGKKFIIAAICAQGLGYYCLRKIINIKV